MRRKSLLILLLLLGCNFIPEKVTMDDPRVQALVKAAASFDRIAYGFTPIPQTADVRLELRPRDTYDAMLHIYSKTSRTIAFRKTNMGYKWIGEQEIFSGPRQYTTVDGTSYEEIVLTYETEHISGPPLNQLHIDYFGDDSRLANRQNLTLTEIQPILKEWNY